MRARSSSARDVPQVRAVGSSCREPSSRTRSRPALPRFTLVARDDARSIPVDGDPGPTYVHNMGGARDMIDPRTGCEPARDDGRPGPADPRHAPHGQPAQRHVAGPAGRRPPPARAALLVPGARARDRQAAGRTRHLARVPGGLPAADGDRRHGRRRLRRPLSGGPRVLAGEPAPAGRRGDRRADRDGPGRRRRRRDPALSGGRHDGAGLRVRRDRDAERRGAGGRRPGPGRGARARRSTTARACPRSTRGLGPSPPGRPRRASRRSRPRSSPAATGSPATATGPPAIRSWSTPSSATSTWRTRCSASRPGRGSCPARARTRAAWAARSRRS